MHWVRFLVIVLRPRRGFTLPKLFFGTCVALWHSTRTMRPDFVSPFPFIGYLWYFLGNRAARAGTAAHPFAMALPPVGTGEANIPPSKNIQIPETAIVFETI